MQTQGGAAEREDPALHFHLGETGIAGTEVDIGGQHQLDANGQAITLGGDNHRFADPGPGEHPHGSQPPGGACQPLARAALALIRSSPAVKCSPWPNTIATRASLSASNRSEEHT